MEFWIDRGGTFTDVIVRLDSGELRTTKVLSSAPGRYEDAALHGMQTLATTLGHPNFAKAPVRAIRMGTTVATNALLERQGEPTVLLITAGLRDALIIGEQHRPDIFALSIRRPAPLFSRIIEVNERLASDGSLVRPLDEDALGDALRAAFADGLRSAAVVLLNAYRNPAHEARCAALARAAGFEQVSLSHEVSGLARLVGRGDTTVVDAYLTPVLSRYVDKVANGVGTQHADKLRFMQSNGGLTAPALFRGANSVLSGPAGGVVGMVRTAAAAGIDQVIGFDMGGTSTDIALYDRQYERRIDNRIAGVRLQAPMLHVHTIAAGGGSVLAYRDGRLQVGPASAGAHPGPRCYRMGGPLAVTDIQACLGRLQPDRFPGVFGPDGDQPLDIAASREGFAELGEQLPDDNPAPEDVAAKFLTVAIDTMALAVRRAALSRGIDVDRFALASFGGAAGQHACAVARALGLRTVLVHPQASVLSALGIGLADHRRVQLANVNNALNDDALQTATQRARDIGRDLCAALTAEGKARIETRLLLRFDGSDTTLTVPLADIARVTEDFHVAHEQRFGLRGRGTIVIEALSVEAIVDGAPTPSTVPAAATQAHADASRRVWFDGQWLDTPVWPRERLAAAQTVTGPALIVDAHSTVVLEPDWVAEVLGDGQLRLTDQRGVQRVAGNRTTDDGPTDDGATVDPARLEQFNNLFVHIAQQMGTVLQQTARSVNIKERLDFSCALFDREGRLLANAPHMPVHLGSMGDSVSAVRAAFPGAARGDSFVLNDPYAGGTHLPDITVVTPFFGDADAPLFYVASRGHHADVGGVAPGSMPADSRNIDEEGVLLSPMRLVTAGTFEDRAIRRALEGGRYPARNVAQNIADLMAQVAANQKGLALLRQMLAERGVATSLAYAGHVQANAELAVREVIAGLRGGHHVVEMDGGQRIEVSVRIEGDQAIVDFAGTSAQTNNNFNAPAAVCRAAVLYVFRCLVARP
ncbi:MAG: hydantoinase B/oxoprolinase family protein, partial [Pseudomonadota bacterium]